MRSRSLTPFLFAAILVAVGLAPNAANAWKGKTVAVYDGDTIGVLKDGKEVRIRLYGVDTPEKSQDFGQAAKRFASELVFDKVVEVETVDKDMHGRTVGLVTIGDKVLNVELVRAGFAWYFGKYCKRTKLCAELSKLEGEARETERGLWQAEIPTPPWEYRRIQRSVPEHARRKPPKTPKTPKTPKK